MIDTHERLLGKSHKLIEDFTCPITGLPTPEREPARFVSPISPLTLCVRSMWGVSNKGHALAITQEYSIGNIKAIGDFNTINHRELRVDLYESGAPSPASVLHWFAQRDTGPQYQGFGVEAWEPDTQRPGTLKPSLDVQGISHRALTTLTKNSLTWFVPVDLNVSVPGLDLTPIQIDPPILPLASVNGDSRIPITPYQFPEDITASIFVPDNRHRPTCPGPQASRDNVMALKATISEHAAALHGLMLQAGALDISKA